MATDRGEMIVRLLDLALERGAIRYGDFTLSSGRKSTYYFDGRLLSLDPEGAYLLGHALLPLLTGAGVSAVGGPTLGADPIVAAVATASWQQGTPIPAFIVRKEAKGYGMGQMIEGPLPPAGASVAIVDDACTTGGSLFHAIDAAEAAGYRVGLVLAALDRNEGGSDAIPCPRLPLRLPPHRRRGRSNPPGVALGNPENFVAWHDRPTGHQSEMLLTNSAPASPRQTAAAAP